MAEPAAPDPATATAESLDAFDKAVLAWGRTEHGKVVRLCEWFRAMGQKLECTP